MRQIDYAYKRIRWFVPYPGRFPLLESNSPTRPQKGILMKPLDLEDRLVEFAVHIIAIAESLPATKAGNHLSGQLVRSGTSPALNYGEAQSAESRTDFIHKLKVVLKELRETSISLKIVKRTALVDSFDRLGATMAECDELISIFVKSVLTAQAGLQKARGQI
mgnify:FL=1